MVVERSRPMSIQDQVNRVVLALRGCAVADLSEVLAAIDVYDLLLARVHAEHGTLSKLNPKERFVLFGAVTTVGLEAVEALAKRARSATDEHMHDRLRELGLRLQTTTS